MERSLQNKKNLQRQRSNPQQYLEFRQILESLRFVSENTLEFKVAISDKTELLLERIKDLLCQSQNKNVSWDEALRTLANTYLEKNDPIVKAERILKRQMKRQMKNSSQRLVNMSATSKEACEKTFKNQGQLRKPRNSEASRDSRPLRQARHPLPTALKHQIYLRDQGQCQNLNPNGSPCGDSRWTDIHHVIPISQGGLNTIENLVTLCRGHHQLEHWTN